MPHLQKGNRFSACCRSKNVNNVEISEDYSDNELFTDSVESRINNGQVFCRNGSRSIKARDCL